VLDVPGGQVVATLAAPKEEILCAAWSPDGKALATVGTKLRIWDCASGSWTRVSKETTGRFMTGVAWSPDGQWIAAVTSQAPSLWVENARSGELRCRSNLITHQVPFAPHWTLDGKSVVVTQIEDDEGGGYVQVSDARTGDTLRQIRPHNLPLRAALSPDGRTLAVGEPEFQRPLCLWETGSGKLLKALSEGPVRTDYLNWSRDGKRLVTFDGGGSQVRLWGLGADQVSLTIGEVQSYLAKPFALSHDGTRLAVSGPKNKVRVFSWADGKLLETLEAPPDTAPSGVSWSFDDKRIASVIKTWDSSCVWEIGSGKTPRTLKSNGVTNLCWSPTGEHLMGFGQGGVIILNANTGKEERTLVGGSGWPYDTAWSPDGKKLLVAGDLKGNIPVWDFAIGKFERFLVGHAHRPVVSVAWSGDGKTILSAADDGQVRFWDAADGRTLGILLLLTENRHLALTPEGHYRGSPEIEGELVYVAVTDDGTEVLRPSEFAEKYGWKNDPDKVRLVPGADH
jgi:WD40 repeat protein